MANITAGMVKDLREKTGAGMMDCKKALEEANGSMELAVDNLRKSGITKAEKKVGRTTKEGLIFACVENNVAALVEILCETDFVARNEKFQAYGAELVQSIARNCPEDGDVSAAVAAREKDNMVGLISVIGENMQIRRVLRWQTTDGRLSFYNHQSLGKCCVLIEAAGSDDTVLLKDVCMHIAAFSPTYIAPADVPAEVVAKEKEIAAAQVLDKPANIIDKIVSGKVQKWFTDVCLMNQPWIRDDKSCLAKAAPSLKARRFIRWQIGEAL